MPVVVHVWVVDVSFVQLIDGVDVPVLMQSVVDMPVMSNDWCFGSTEQITAVSTVVQVVDWISCWRRVPTV